MFRAHTTHDQQSLFESTQWMDQRIRKKLEKSWAPIFYEHVFRKIDETPFAVLYGTTGNPNFPVNILLSLEYIKHMKSYSDLELLDSFYFDYLVNYAVGVRTIGEMNLAERTLYYFRERLYDYCLENPGQDDILFEQFLGLLKEFAVIAGVTLDEQRTDTTYFMSNIKKAGRMSLAYDVLVRAIKAIPAESLTDELSKALDGKFKTDVLYRSKSEDYDSKLTMLLTLCNKALLILEYDPNTHESEEARIAKRFLSEQSVIGADGKIAAKPKKEISPSSLQSAYDEGATFRKKGNENHCGYKLEISETCGDENPFQLITDYVVAPNNVSDGEMLEGRLEKINENTGCMDMYVDGGFHCDGVHQAAEENGIEIHLTNMSGTNPSTKMDVSEFDIDKDTNIIIRCPGGHAPIRAGVSNSQTTAHFPHEACRNCEFRDQCHSKEQKKDHVVRIALKAVEVSREREQMKSEIAENTSKRAGIEGTNSALKRTGHDKLDVRGKNKCTIVSALKVTAQNIKRFIKYRQGGYKAKPSDVPRCRIHAPSFA